ncbi:MAG: CCA tRNA nucleotidyltransferase [Lachnospiraceae bacterium]|nr:CCA tRNA nucleotidyltransferase [Lachnospiraceae bacterium]
MRQILLPDKVQYIIKTLLSHGFEAYAVGGCVRDSLLGRIPEDWDITTSAKPQEVKALFSHTIDTGIEHGTVTVMLEHEGFEVTTYRIDGEYEDGRHPKQVEFTSNLTEDLRRRDFTINALAYNDETGIVDAFDGIGDMQNRIIRCVGNADERFDEDALRILRAVRFSAQLDFTIEPDTLRSVASHALDLRKISAERIRVELTKLLLSNHPKRLLTAYETGITEIVLPEFDRMMKTEQENPHHIYNVGIHSMRAVEYLAEKFSSNPTILENTISDLDAISEAATFTKKEQTALRYAALLHDVGKPDTKTIDEQGVAHFYRHPQLSADLARSILRRLKFDNDTIALVTLLIREHDVRYAEPGQPIAPRTMRRILNRVGTDKIDLLFTLQEADLHAQNPTLLPDKLTQLDSARRLTAEIIAANQCVSLKELAVNGSDLIAAGFAPGKELGIILAALLEHVLEQPEDNQKEILLALAHKTGTKAPSADI